MSKIDYFLFVYLFILFVCRFLVAQKTNLSSNTVYEASPRFKTLHVLPLGEPSGARLTHALGVEVSQLCSESLG